MPINIMIGVFYMENYVIRHSNFNPTEQPSKETVFTLTNGFIGLRGSIEFSTSQMKGTFCAGCFNSGDLALPELVKIPDPLSLNIWLHDSTGMEKLTMNKDNVTVFSESLNMERGLFSYTFE